MARPGPGLKRELKRPYEVRADPARNFGDLDNNAHLGQTSRPFARAVVVASILVLNGPNLNLLGTREPAVYGRDTLADLERAVIGWGRALGLAVDCRQSNSELALIETVHAAKAAGTSYIVINPGGFTHTSVALRDALAAVSIPFVEVHLSNVHARESFRRHSYFSDAATGVVCGFGLQGYRFALEAIAQRLGARPDAEEAEEIQTGI